MPKGDELDPYRTSGDIHRLKSIDLDRKLSATAHLPKRSTTVENPTRKIAQASNVHAQRSQEFGHAPAPRPMNAQPVLPSSPSPRPGGRSRGQPPSQSATPVPQQQQQSHQQGPQRPAVSPVDPPLYTPGFRPPFSRGATEVKIVDDSVPNSPATGMDDPMGQVPPEEGITLADIPIIW
jgi:hypothetical protein